MNKIITEYVSEKVWDDGGSTLSFKMDDYIRKQLLDAPDGAFIQIKRSNREGKGSHYMSYKAQEAGASHAH
jgi:hypothetical protein